MPYQIKALSCDPSRLIGLSEKLIVSHCENNYGGAVKRLNAITEQLHSLDFITASVFAINGLKREELIAMNSMILHELYFDGLGTAELLPDHTCNLADAALILALDMYEHSYHIDYGAKAAAYVDAFMSNINWESAADRYHHVAGQET